MALTINTQPSGLKFAGSPLLVKMTSTNASQDEFKYILEVKIYHGTSAPSDATYTLEKLPNSSISNSAIFNIARLIESELEPKTPSDLSATNNAMGKGIVWVNLTAKASWVSSGSETTAGNTFTATMGYTLMQDETINHDGGLGTTKLAMNRPSNTTVFIDHDFFVPIVREYHTQLKIGYGGSTHTVTPTSSTTNSSNRIIMVNVTKILRDTLSHEDDFTYHLTDGTDVTPTISITAGCEPKYSAIPVAYLNRWGIWEVLYMSKKKVRTNSISSVQYQRPHFIDDNTIDMSRKGVTTYNAQTKVSYTLNSDLLDEAENEMYIDLYRSSYIAIYVDGVWKHVTIDNKQYTEQTSLNDRIIKHTITFTQGYTDENLIM